MKSLIKGLLRKRPMVHITVVFRANGNIDKTLDEIEEIINRHPEMDFKVTVQW